MESEALAQRLAQLSAAEKQRLLAHLLREKAKQQASAPPRADASLWVKDAKLDPSIQPLPVEAFKRPTRPRTILLTGATGFLGAHLLNELLEHTKHTDQVGQAGQAGATIYCLVRAGDHVEAQQRLSANFARYFSRVLDSDRVRPVVGDLARPQLGVAPETYEMLAQETDVIIHNGAHLHHMAPYGQLKSSNVDSTVSMLRLATTAKPKWIHYVSTLVAGVDRDGEGLLVEEFPQADPSELAGGYAQSKWVSEKLLAEASKRGVGVTIFRPGFISGRSDNGIWPLENDHLLRVVKGCLQMGYAPESDLVPNMAPVDFVAAAMVRIALSEDTSGQVFNLSNPQLVSWATLLDWLRGCGYKIRVVPNPVWREQHLSRLDKENALFPVLPLYLGGDITDTHVRLVTKLAKVRNDCTAQMLARLQMIFPVIDRNLWQRYVRFFQESGFLRI